MDTDETTGHGSGFVGATPIIGNQVRLRPIDTADYGALYWMEQDPAISPRFRQRTASVRPEHYGDVLWHNVVCAFAVDSIADGSLIGMVSVTDADGANGHARIGMIVRPDLVDETWPLEMAELLLDHVFSVFPFRKVYAEVVATAIDQYRRANVFFEVEGRLVEHLWCEGQWEDVVILAVHRSAWLKRSESGTAPAAPSPTNDDLGNG